MRNADNMGYTNKSGKLFRIDKEFMLASNVEGGLIELVKFFADEIFVSLFNGFLSLYSRMTVIHVLSTQE